MQSIFDLGKRFGNYCNEGWRNIVDIILYLNELDALPDSLVEMDDFVDSEGINYMTYLKYLTQIGIIQRGSSSFRTFG